MHTGNSASAAGGPSSLGGGGGGVPISPVSDNERVMEKYSPWAFRDEGSDRLPTHTRSQISPLYRPPPKDVEILLKTYWTSIHPVSNPLPARRRL